MNSYASAIECSVRVNQERACGRWMWPSLNQLAPFGVVRGRCNRLHARPLSKPPPPIESEAQRAAHSRACLIVRAGDALRKRASAHKALIRMSSVVLTWSAGKPPMRAHPISSAVHAWQRVRQFSANSS